MAPIETGFLDRLTDGAPERIDCMKVYAPVFRLGKSEDVVAKFSLASRQDWFFTRALIAGDEWKYTS